MRKQLGWTSWWSRLVRGQGERQHRSARSDHPFYIFPEEFTTELFSKVHSVGLRLRSHLIWGDNGLPQIPPHPALRVPANTWNLQLWPPFFIHLNVWFCGIYSVGGSGLIESLLLQTVSYQYKHCEWRGTTVSLLCSGCMRGDNSCLNPLTETGLQ